ncbi:hypothetical protein [Pseudomonas frederiksbergensis]|uniref:hypothetical protein n=1 Tax=Pseudomonas frederiksbergensis TaxID=104087 RepID=UPI003D1C6DF0
MAALPGSVVIVLICLGGTWVVLSAGIFLEIVVTPSRASLAPTGFVSCAKHVNDINPVGAKLARDAFVNA